MTDGQYMAVALVAFAVGVGILFGPISREDQPAKGRGWVVILLTALGALYGAYALMRHGHPVWALLLGAFTGGMFTAVCRDSLGSRRTPLWLHRFLWCAAMGASALLVNITYHRAEDLRWEQDQIKAREARIARRIQEREEKMVREIRALRQSWEADPARGVAELPLDRLVVWLAVPPTVEIDSEYEASLADNVRREVPIRVTFLNDSFFPVTPETAAGLTPAGWSMEIRDANGVVMHRWEQEESPPRPLQPAERRDYRVVWDGRDSYDNLAPPGRYEVTFELAGGGSRVLPLQITDAGPIEIVEVDAVTEYIRHQQDMMRWRQTMQEGMRLLDQQRSLQMQMQRWPR